MNFIYTCLICIAFSLSFSTIHAQILSQDKNNGKVVIDKEMLQRLEECEVDSSSSWNVIAYRLMNDLPVNIQENAPSVKPEFKTQFASLSDDEFVEWIINAKKEYLIEKQATRALAEN